MITRRAVLIFGSAAALITFIRMPAQTFKPAKEPHMDIDIKRIGSRPSQKGPEDWFTGTVRIDPLFQAPEPARTGAAQVTFEPGARTDPHRHTGVGRWQGRRLDGEGQRRAIPEVMSGPLFGNAPGYRIG